MNTSTDTTVGTRRIPVTTISPLGPVEIVLFADRVVVSYGHGQFAATSRKRFQEWFFYGTDTLRLSGGLALDFGRTTFRLTVHESTPWTAPGVVVRDLAWSLTDDERSAA